MFKETLVVVLFLFHSLLKAFSLAYSLFIPGTYGARQPECILPVLTWWVDPFKSLLMWCAVSHRNFVRSRASDVTAPPPHSVASRLRASVAVDPLTSDSGHAFVLEWSGFS